MTNGSIDYTLGQIQSKLESESEILIRLENKVDVLSANTNKTVTDLCTEIGTLKGKASLWGGVTSFIVSAIMGIAGWFLFHISKG